jgi:hypothetical protein
MITNLFKPSPCYKTGKANQWLWQVSSWLVLCKYFHRETDIVIKFSKELNNVYHQWHWHCVYGLLHWKALSENKITTSVEAPFIDLYFNDMYEEQFCCLAVHGFPQREPLLKEKAEYNWEPCAKWFKSAASDNESSINISKQVTLKFLSFSLAVLLWLHDFWLKTFDPKTFGWHSQDLL